MATANAASDCSDTESEIASSEIISLDGLTAELVKVNLRVEILAFHLKNNKAVHKHIIPPKDDKIEK
ncbi:hypothetical protein DPMN_153857 [Dreissena polymorpha]|uniref:Uncharacterized protein n=1 Tax=Dreissena polymorpha TaxID=45954 RepID=A0A9D4J569_DREPO|nr:hypothetical protein DPMN_153857 [Dreissena polymorpha]